MDIELLRADITSVKVDAIVNPTNPQLQHVGALGRVVVREGGEIIQRESAGLAPVPPGNAVVTTGGNLLCKFVIHAVGPRAGDRNADETLRSATWSSLRRAEELALGSVAFPAMATGVFGLPLERSARVMLAATIDFRPHARSLRRVVYCLFGVEAHAEFTRVLRELEG